MAFGITGELVSGAEFEAPIEDAVKKIASLAGSIQVIRIYAHGAPGMIHSFDASQLETMLKSKIAPKGEVNCWGAQQRG